MLLSFLNTWSMCINNQLNYPSPALLQQTRELLATNDDLKVELRHARAEASVLSKEKKYFEERLLIHPLPAPRPQRLKTAKGDIAADTDCDSGSGDRPVARNYRRMNDAHGERELASPFDRSPILAINNEQASKVLSLLGPKRVESSGIDDSKPPPTMETLKESVQPYCRKRLPRAARISSNGYGPGSVPPGNDADVRPSVGKAKDGGVSSSSKVTIANSRGRSKCRSPSSTERSSPSPENSTGPRRSRRAARFGSSRKWGRRDNLSTRTYRTEGSNSNSGSSMINDSSRSPASLKRLESKHHSRTKGKRRGLSERPLTVSEQRDFLGTQRPPSSLPRGDPTGEEYSETRCPSR